MSELIRLKVNIIINGKSHPRGSLLEESLIPERLRNETHIARDPEDRQGLVLLLRDLSFQSLPRGSASGIPTSFPTHIAAGELLDLEQVPESYRKSLKEGEDFKTTFSFEEVERFQRIEADIYHQQPNAEPAAVTGSRSRFYSSAAGAAAR